MKAVLLYLLPAMIFCSVSLASQDTLPPQEKRIRDLRIVPLPAVASNPANGWMFGFAPSATWYMGDPEDTRISNFVGNFLYTTKKQWIFSFRSNIFSIKTNGFSWVIGDISSPPSRLLGWVVQRRIFQQKTPIRREYGGGSSKWISTFFAFMKRF